MSFVFSSTAIVGIVDGGRFVPFMYLDIKEVLPTPESPHNITDIRNGC